MSPKVALIGASAVIVPVLAYADDGIEYHFGFLSAVNIGDVGEKEVESRIESRLGKRAGSYNALSHKVEAEFVPWQDFRLSVATSVAYHDIVGVPGLDDRNWGAFNGISLGFRYRLLDREHAPFGLAIEAEPQWSRVDGTSGAPVDQYGNQLSVLVDKELIPNRIISVFNLVYEPEASRSRITGAWSRESTFRVAAAVMAQPQPNFFAGAEARYLRKYEGLALDTFEGHALYLGPTVSAKLGQYWLLAAWNIQVAGRSVEEPGRLDLKNFERHQVRFKFGFSY
ncbi:MAG: hypothetical protein GEU95_14215 [Rhizobiales bacterium]|nr:hypothetical protein [Hyphomicrobiales bacterium]